MSTPTKAIPKDASVMQEILSDMGVQDYEPKVVNQMLEFTYKYVTDVLEEARLYSEHAGKKNIDVDDLRLATQMLVDHQMTQPPPRELLLEIAAAKNKAPLPLVKSFSGPKLPPDRYCLCGQNFRVKSRRPPPTPTSAQFLNATPGMAILRQQPVSVIRPTAPQLTTTIPYSPPEKRIKRDDDFMNL